MERTRNGPGIDPVPESHDTWNVVLAVLGAIVGLVGFGLQLADQQRWATWAQFVAFLAFICFVVLTRVALVRLTSHVVHLRQHMIEDAEARRTAPRPRIAVDRAQIEKVAKEEAGVAAHAAAEAALDRRLEALREEALRSADARRSRVLAATKAYLHGAAASLQRAIAHKESRTDYYRQWEEAAARATQFMVGAKQHDLLLKIKEQVGYGSFSHGDLTARISGLTQFARDLSTADVRDDIDPVAVSWTEPRIITLF